MGDANTRIFLFFSTTFRRRRFIASNIRLAAKRNTWIINCNLFGAFSIAGIPFLLTSGRPSIRRTRRFVCVHLMQANCLDHFPFLRFWNQRPWPISNRWFVFRSFLFFFFIHFPCAERILSFVVADHLSYCASLIFFVRWFSDASWVGPARWKVEMCSVHTVNSSSRVFYLLIYRAGWASETAFSSDESRISIAWIMARMWNKRSDERTKNIKDDDKNHAKKRWLFPINQA